MDPPAKEEPAAGGGPLRGGQTLGSLGSALRAYGSVGVLLVAGFAGLWAYQLRAWRRGPSPDHAAQMLQRWYRWAWRWLRLDVDIDGAAPDVPCIYVSNHRSYLDIPILSGAVGGTFLSRADVAEWPLVGAVARAIDAVFVARDDPRDRMRAARRLLRRVRTSSVIVFPEGTTTGERLPGPFEPGLFRLLHRAEAPIVPVTVRYGARRAYWTENITLWAHLRTRVFTERRLRVVVHLGEPLHARDFRDAAGLADAVHAAVARPIDAWGELVPLRKSCSQQFTV